jgi:hypothetical protein
MILAICVNDSGKPNEISSKRWIKKGEVYEVERIGVVGTGHINIHLKKPKLTDDDFPYTGFSHTRFRFNKKNHKQEADEEVEKMLKDLGF